jgi:hypothetical protein
MTELDQIGFLGVDDRVFAQWYDTPSVENHCFGRGYEKTVRTDAACVGLRGGPQAKLVDVAKDIDLVVGSERWVRR